MKEKASIEITDRDIATIEALHDSLLDRGIFDLNKKPMKLSRELTKRMYAALGYDVDVEKIHKTQNKSK